MHVAPMEDESKIHNAIHTMKGWGTTLILLGIGSFILPAMNLQFSLISIFGQGNETVTGVVFIALGGLMMLAGKRNQA